VNTPSGFKTWRLYWFQCPACGHRSFRSHAKVGASDNPTRILWRFWCERCAAYSTLKYPYLNATFAWVFAVAIFLALYNAILAFEISLLWALLICVVVGAILHLLAGGLTRLTNTYASINDVEP
jgi:hypothetical protein